jgi:hypothetical protein
MNCEQFRLRLPALPVNPTNPAGKEKAQSRNFEPLHSLPLQCFIPSAPGIAII